MYKENLHFCYSAHRSDASSSKSRCREEKKCNIGYCAHSCMTYREMKLVFVPFYWYSFAIATKPLLDLEDSMDPDLGDSSRFARHSAVRSTWSAGRNIHQKLDEVSKKEKQQQKRSTGHAFRKIGKLFSGK